MYNKRNGKVFMSWKGIVVLYIISLLISIYVLIRYGG